MSQPSSTSARSGATRCARSGVLCAAPATTKGALREITSLSAGHSSCITGPRMASPTSASAAEARRTTRPLASEQDARRARRSLRRCTRGAAMVEALILVPVLILLDVSLLYMHSVYDTRLATMRGARREVWPYALGACETSSGPSVSKDGTDPSLAPLSGLFAQGKRIARGRTLLDPLDTGLDVGAASSVKASRGAAEVDGFRSHTMTTHSRVLCNERQDGISEADRRATIHLLYGQLL